jgi:hypothetical protein
MAKKFSDNAEIEGDDKLKIPKELESFKSYKEVDREAGLEMMDKYAEELKNDYKAEKKELPKEKEGGNEEGGEEETTEPPEPTTTDDEEGSKEPDESDPAEGDDEEIKKQKEKIKTLKDDIANLKKAAESGDSNSKSIASGALPNKERNLNKELEKLKELQKKEPAEEVKDSVEPDKIIDDEEESEDLVDTKEKSPVQSTKALPKFMKFEDYIATKKKK